MRRFGWMRLACLFLVLTVLAALVRLDDGEAEARSLAVRVPDAMFLASGRPEEPPATPRTEAQISSLEDVSEDALRMGAGPTPANPGLSPDLDTSSGNPNRAAQRGDSDVDAPAKKPPNPDGPKKTRNEPPPKPSDGDHSRAPQHDRSPSREPQRTTPPDPGEDQQPTPHPESTEKDPPKPNPTDSQYDRSTGGSASSTEDPRPGTDRAPKADGQQDASSGDPRKPHQETSSGKPTPRDARRSQPARKTARPRKRGGLNRSTHHPPLG